MKDNRDIILEQVLKAVPFDGWSDHALREAAKRAGASDAELRKAFPGGIGDCVAYFLERADRKLESVLPEQVLAGLRVPARIEKIILTRLAHWLPVREAVRRLTGYNAMPWNSFRALKALYATVDNIWRIAGDNSTDFSYYTRRMTLAAVYSSTLLFWLNDHSEGQQDTAAFLARRLKNVADFGRLKKQIKCPPKMA